MRKRSLRRELQWFVNAGGILKFRAWSDTQISALLADLVRTASQAPPQLIREDTLKCRYLAPRVLRDWLPR
jgi:hypothetical protein